MSDPALLKLKLEELAAQEQRIKLIEGLPHLHGRKWYKWAWDFFESRNKINLITAGNQLSKSSTMIRKAIHWATETELWPELWPGFKPNMFWYFYPTADLATQEFETKWQEFLPRGEYKDHPKYGWKKEYKNKQIYALRFNSGLNIYFKSYAQGADALQAGTVAALFNDEETPIKLYDELMFRVSASDGYFHSVFTATLGQDFWRLVMEPEGHETERLPEAFKQQVSAYDCQTYLDGSKSQWNDARIAQVIAKCKDQNEVLKRVFGKFIRTEGGRKCQHFDIKKHVREGHHLPKDWHIYAGVDVGSGGKDGHPSAICFVAVRPDYQAARVVLGWRGDGIRTTSDDVVDQFIRMKQEKNFFPTGQFYDWASADFHEFAVRKGEGAFQKADKGQDKGEEILDALFKNDMLMIYRDDELMKLASELATLRKEASKKHAKDDFYDALRYACSRIPWDWSAIGLNTLGIQEHQAPKHMNDTQRQIYERRQQFEDQHAAEVQRIEDEIAEANELYDAY